MDGIAQTIGVLRYNDKVREEMLGRIYWKDKQYTSAGGNFVKYAEIKDREAASLTNGNGLKTYTHDSNTDYSKTIRRRYDWNTVTKKDYSTNGDIADTERWKWLGDYFNDFTENNELSRVGDKARQQEKVTEIYANDRRFLLEKYLTPNLVRFYGSNPGVALRNQWNSIDGYYTGRIPEIGEANVKIVRDSGFAEWIKRGSISAKILGGMLEEAEKKYPQATKYNPQNKYIEYVLNDNGVSFYKPSAFDDNTFTIWERKNRYPNYGGVYINFDERDFAKTIYPEDEKEETEGGVAVVGAGGASHIVLTDREGVESFRTPSVKPKSLLTKTNELFNQHKIATLAARFHTTIGENGLTDEPEETDTAKSADYGNSRGRNLLRKNPENSTNGYDNPYCRVWTYHHQYDNFTKAIRPFESKAGNIYSDTLLPYSVKLKGVTDTGRDYLKKHTVLNENGLLKIAPKGTCGNLETQIKDCMFSIENLAWKDVPNKPQYLSKEQRGPNGGRIMWFPPYDLDFHESVNVDWNSNKFIGRGEPIYTYSNTSREGTLSFALLIDHPSIIDNIPKYNIKPDDGERDMEADVLRFFAGCQIPELVGEMDCEEKEDEKKQKPGDEPKEAVNKTKSKCVSFYVFFPNNYSGRGVLIDEEINNSTTDVNWFDYIYCGKDATEFSGGNGYEMRDGVGISTSGDKKHSMPVYPRGSYESGENPKGQPVDNLFYKYRVDFDSHQFLNNVYPKSQGGGSRGMQFESGKDKSAYVDSTGFSLNAKPFDGEGGVEAATHSFRQILASLYKSNKKEFADAAIAGTSIEQYADEELVEAFKKGSFTKLEVYGGASRQDSPNTKKLAERRRWSVMKLLTDYGNMKDIQEPNLTMGEIEFENLSADEMTSNNLRSVKIRKCAFAKLYYNVPEVAKVSETVHASAGNVIEERSKNSLNKTESKNVLQDKAFRVDNYAPNPSSQKLRYETEAEYFKNLDKTSPFVYKNLIEKFKYFNPAFHSMSPEGFNARLTFLQQCTRQGHTISATDLNYGKTAGNLAFGRMPVCVLKIGDFINTRIVVKSVSIDYGANGVPQWDLNPEGIGVQPMYAKVQMGISILGGQSLDGPISRLQNAVTFNYYANTGVYDDRSDRIERGALEAKTYTGDGEFVRKVQETGKNDTHIWDVSKYDTPGTTTYKNIFTPTLDLEWTEADGEKTGYNEAKRRGKITLSDDGSYKYEGK